MTESTTVTVNDVALFKHKALYWANQFRTVCLLDNNDQSDKYHSQNWSLAVDTLEELVGNENAFEHLKEFQQKTKSLIFGFLSYDLKNQVEKLQSHHPDFIQFPLLYFFKPRYVFQVDGDKLSVNRNFPETAELIDAIEKTQVPEATLPGRLKLQARTSKEKYLEHVGSIKNQIEEGVFYEMNYCNEFFALSKEIDPVNVFMRLNEKARAPFSAFFKYGDKFLLCASPERFLRKEKNKLSTQPMKGTIKKGNTEAENEKLKLQLLNDIKERAENVMIVDLMRNDLAKSSKPGSVKVEELFGIYEFNTVNQMISTVVSELSDKTHFADAIRNAFPMGSMTGAPKVEVMKNIEFYEEVKRGLFSGAVGYITPETDFDFNVVIRSILYNSSTKYLSIQAGGAITSDSISEKEYDEVLLKASSMMEVLNAEL